MLEKIKENLEFEEYMVEEGENNVRELLEQLKKGVTEVGAKNICDRLVSEKELLEKHRYTAGVLRRLVRNAEKEA